MKSINGNTLKQMIFAGANALTERRDDVDALNVFPVPDGDTGTNMSLTAMAAAQEAGRAEDTAQAVSKALSQGALRGARGNSGVILSQLFRGFAKGLEHVDVIHAADLVRALNRSVETAYKAVMKPKEGTILTVATAIANEAEDKAAETDEVDEILAAAIWAGNEMLKRTTDMLPALKQANVVDAGGQGYLIFLQSAYEVLTGKTVVEIATSSPAQVRTLTPAAESNAEIKFGFCTELFVGVKDFDKAEELSVFLEEMGDSVVLVCDEDAIKIHVHTNEPGKVVNHALAIDGFSLMNIKIENMHIQHSEMSVGAKPAAQTPATPVEMKDIGFVTVSIGAGLDELFLNLGADKIIQGGQTMNPSAEDIVAAVNAVNAHDVIIFPNNPNIILTANLAATMVTGKTAHVVPTRSVPQGITALCHYTHQKDAAGNVEEMTEAAKMVATGQVTTAVRDSMADNKVIKQNDIIGLTDGKITAVESTPTAAALALIKGMVTDETEIITIFYGADTPESEAEALMAQVNELYGDIETELQSGGQPLYYYIIAVE